MQQPAHNPARGQLTSETIEALRSQIARIETARRPRHDASISSGCGPLDRLLPGRGFRRAMLVEWLSAGSGTGAETMALLTAREACRDGGALVVLDRRWELYPPAAARLGIELENLIVVRAVDKADNDWALDQALRCPAVAAAVAWPERLDGRTFRRWQLAAEEGGGLGLLIREQAARDEPSWADVRLLVEPLPASDPATGRRIRIHLLRARGTANNQSVDVEIDDETHPLYLATQLVQPTDHRRAAGA